VSHALKTHQFHRQGCGAVAFAAYGVEWCVRLPGYNLRQRSHHLTLPFTDQEEFSAQDVIYGYLLGVCVGVCLPTGVCIFQRIVWQAE